MSTNRGLLALEAALVGIFPVAALISGAPAGAQVASTTTVQRPTQNVVVIITPGPPETVTYIYDGRGRLIKVTHAGGLADGTNACYSHDKADNRTNVTVALGPGGACVPS